MSVILLIVNKLSTPLLKTLIYNILKCIIHTRHEYYRGQDPDTHDYCGLKSEIRGE